MMIAKAARRVPIVLAATIIASSALGTRHASAAPTAEQKAAIRSACSQDYQSVCAGVPTGGQAALSCLQRNMSSLSEACQGALGAISSGPPEGAPPASRPPSLAQACAGDFRAFCPGVRLGGGRALMCLRANAASLSPPCQGALSALRR